MNNEQTPTLIQYSRKKNGQLNGCMVATLADDKIKFGYSKCNKVDRFSKAFARQLAVDRMNSERVCFENVPESMIKDAAKFVARIFKYYKGSNFNFQTENERSEKIKELVRELTEINYNKKS